MGTVARSQCTCGAQIRWKANEPESDEWALVAERDLPDELDHLSFGAVSTQGAFCPNAPLASGIYRVGRPMSRTGILHSVDAIEMLGETIAIVEESELLRGEPITVQESEGKVYGEAIDVGLSFVADLTGRVHTIQMHAAGHEGYEPFEGELPMGVQFSDTRDRVRHRLGVPTLMGEPTDVHSLGRMPAWDRYDGELVSVHLEYTLEGAGVRMVSVMLRNR